MSILVNNLQEATVVNDGQLGLLEKVLQAGLARFGKAEAEVSVILVSDEYIHELNLEYRALDQPTDVLSFVMAEDLPETPSYLTTDMPELLGDIYISVPRTVEQAVTYGHSFERELCYLGVHGLLHLLGYDHQDEAQTEKMREQEELLLTEFTLGRVSD